MNFSVDRYVTAQSLMTTRFSLTLSWVKGSAHESATSGAHVEMLPVESRDEHTVTSVVFVVVVVGGALLHVLWRDRTEVVLARLDALAWEQKQAWKFE